MVAFGLSGQGNHLSPSLKSAIPLRSFANAVSPSFIHKRKENNNRRQAEISVKLAALTLPIATDKPHQVEDSIF